MGETQLPAAASSVMPLSQPQAGKASGMQLVAAARGHDRVGAA